MARRRASRFVAIEAESAESEEYDSAVVSEEFDGPLVQPRTPAHRDFAAELEARYAGVEDEDEDEAESVLEAPSQSKLLPTARSPLLFLVRCAPGRELETCTRLFESAQTLARRAAAAGGDAAAPPMICSIVQKAGLPGYLYVEAFRKQAVEDCAAGVNGVAWRRLAIVPREEMVDALTYARECTAGEYARVKEGKYRGDLVQVLEVLGDAVTIRAVPRLDGLAGATTRGRPPQRLFCADEHAGRAVRRDDGYALNRDFYRDGYLIKSVLRTSLDFDVEPSFRELELLGAHGRVEASDEVRVAAGDLKNLVGRVAQVSGGTAVVEAGARRYEVPVGDLERHCVPGAEVSYNGRNGIVLSVKDGEAVLAMNNFTEEVVCPLAQVRRPVAERAVATAAEAPRLQRPREDRLVNKPVVIHSGRGRGMHGIVKSVQRGQCRVQLDATMEIVTVDVGAVAELAARSQSPAPAPVPAPSTIAAEGAATPGFRTPGFRTPGYRTPGYRTPGYKTPGYKTPGNAWAAAPVAQPAVRPVSQSKFAGTLLLSGGQSVRVVDMEGDRFLLEDGGWIAAADAVYCAPERYDDVIVVGTEGFGTVGALVAVEGATGTVRAKDGTVLEVALKDLAKKAPGSSELI